MRIASHQIASASARPRLCNQVIPHPRSFDADNDCQTNRRHKPSAISSTRLLLRTASSAEQLPDWDGRAFGAPGEIAKLEKQQHKDLSGGVVEIAKIWSAQPEAQRAIGKLASAATTRRPSIPIQGETPKSDLQIVECLAQSWIGMAGRGVVAALASLPIGALCFRLRGPYFGDLHDRHRSGPYAAVSQVSRFRLGRRRHDHPQSGNAPLMMQFEAKAAY